jgi:hypothetical protein
MRRDGGSVFPAHANTGDPNDPVEACPLMRSHRRAAIDDQKFRVRGSNHQTFEKLDEDIGAQGRCGWPQRNSELRGLQREGEIIDAFLAAQHQKNPLFLRKRHAQIRRLNV